MPKGSSRSFTPARGTLLPTPPTHPIMPTTIFTRRTRSFRAMATAGVSGHACPDSYRRSRERLTARVAPGALAPVPIEHEPHDRTVDTAAQTQVRLVAIQPARWCPETDLVAQICPAIRAETCNRQLDLL